MKSSVINMILPFIYQDYQGSYILPCIDIRIQLPISINVNAFFRESFLLNE